MLTGVSAFFESRGGTMFVLASMLIFFIMLCVILAFVAPASDRMYVFLSGILAGQVGNAGGSFYTMLKSGPATPKDEKA